MSGAAPEPSPRASGASRPGPSPRASGAARLAELLRASGPAVVLTGAGISVPSGIPDFRTPTTGVWANVDPMEVAHISVWRRDPARFWAFYGQRFAILDGKRPNGAHHAIAELERRGLVAGVITQNIDGLHAAAGSEAIEVHGSIRTASCLACGASFSLAETRARGAVPRCDCGAVLKPDVVLFGELLPERAMLRATALAATTRLLIAVGSSLEVWPVAGLPEETLNAGGALALVTKGATPYDDAAAVKLTGDVESELASVLALL
ncbi:MAG TPA: NAD-dependent deacylase [Solirubrobacter sp.]|nr:NAD-dependent deacylase [Solirubrobacter sp.]